MLRDSHGYGFSPKPWVHGRSRGMGAARSSRVRSLLRISSARYEDRSYAFVQIRGSQVSTVPSAARGLGGGVERETSDGQRFDHALVKRLVEEVVDLASLVGPRRQALGQQ